MRILLAVHQFFPDHSSGTEVLVRDAGLELLRRGHEVHVLTGDGPVGEESSHPHGRDYVHRGLKVHAVHLPSRITQRQHLSREYENPDVAAHVRRYLSEIEPEAIHVFHLMRLSGTTVDALAERGVPLLFTATDFWSVCYRATLLTADGELCGGPDRHSSNCLACRGADRWFPPRLIDSPIGRRGYFRRLARRAGANRPGDYEKVILSRIVIARTRYLRERMSQIETVLAPTRLMRRLLIENGFDASRVRYSPYGVDTEPFRARRRLRDGTGPLRVGFAGTITNHKGVAVLIDGFRRTRPASGATLTIAGRLSNYPDYTRGLLEAIGGDQRISLKGHVDNEEMPKFFEGLDVLVVPSLWYENAPLVISSALAAGLPVVASDLGGMSELVLPGHNGLLFARGDPPSLATQLNRLIEDRALLAGLSERATEPRSLADNVDELLELYAPQAGPRA